MMAPIIVMRQEQCYLHTMYSVAFIPVNAKAVKNLSARINKYVGAKAVAMEVTNPAANVTRYTRRRPNLHKT